MRSGAAGTGSTKVCSAAWILYRVSPNVASRASGQGGGACRELQNDYTTDTPSFLELHGKVERVNVVLDRRALPASITSLPPPTGNAPRPGRGDIPLPGTEPVLGQHGAVERHKQRKRATLAHVARLPEGRACAEHSRE